MYNVICNNLYYFFYLQFSSMEISIEKPSFVLMLKLLIISNALNYKTFWSFFYYIDNDVCYSHNSRECRRVF